MMALEWIADPGYLKFNYYSITLFIDINLSLFVVTVFEFCSFSIWFRNCFGNPATGWGSDCNLYKCPTAISGIGVSPVTTVVCLACHFVLRRSPNSYPCSTSAAMYVHVRPRSETIRCYAPVMGNLGGFPICGPLRKNSDSSRQGSPPNDGVLVLRFRPIRRF